MKKEVLLSDGRTLVFAGLYEGGKEGVEGNSWVSVYYTSYPPLLSESLPDSSVIRGEIEDAGISFIVDLTGRDEFKSYFLSSSCSKTELVFQKLVDCAFYQVSQWMELGEIELTMEKFVVIVKYKLDCLDGIDFTSIRRGSPLWIQLNRVIKRYLFSKGIDEKQYSLESVGKDHFYLDKSFFMKNVKKLTP